METFHNALVVANTLTHQNVLSIRRAIEATETKKIRLHLVYIIPPIPPCFHQIPSIGGIESDISDIARNKLNHIGSLLQISEHQQWLVSGPIKSEARKLAKKLQAEIVIMADIDRESLFQVTMRNIKQFLLKLPKDVPFVILDKSKRAFQTPFLSNI